MRFACLASSSRIGAAILSVSLGLVSWGQEPPAAPVPQNTPETRPLPVLNYSKPVPQFPNPIAPYIPRTVAPPNLANTPRIDGLMHDGKLYLSLNDAIALALENNLDIAIARYNLNIADTDVLRAGLAPRFLVFPSASYRTRPAAASAASEQPPELLLAAPVSGRAELALEPTVWSVPRWAWDRTLPALTRSSPGRCRKIT